MMRANSNAYIRKPSNNSSAVEGEYQISFHNSAYVFPNDPEVCRKCKSFVTQLPIMGAELSEFHNRKLSLVNRSHFLIKLKQIKQEEEQQQEGCNCYLLYYEAVPYSLAFVKANQMAAPNVAFKLEKALKEVISDLAEFNIFSELTIEQCGFTQQGEFRVYVPPLQVLHERRITAQERQRMNAAANIILKYWQGETSFLPPQDSLPPPILQYPNTTRQSYRFNSPQTKKEAQCEASKGYRLSEENTDIKKTIKLSKQYVRESNLKAEERAGHELKKHKSMEYLVRQEEEQKTANHFLSKIDELNKKITNIREALINKRSIDHPRESLDHFISREKENSNKKNLFACISPPKNQEQNYLQEVIFEKKEDKYHQNQNEDEVHFDDACRQREDDRESVDTYLQEIGNQYKMPKFAPINELRNTTLPTELQAIKNSLLGRGKEGSNKDWHHESAGNIVIKRFIQKNKEIYPELNNELPRGPTSLSKISTPADRNSMGFRKETSQQKIKKMLSLEHFQLNGETNSVNLSEFSNELSNAKRRREKEERNRIMKEKVQDILLKSKKAIERLRNPNKLAK